MPDLPPDLDRLRTLETFLRLQLDQVRAAIRAAEAEQRKRQPAPRPASPDPSDPRPAKRGSTPLSADERAWHPDPPQQPPADDRTPWWLLAVGPPQILHRQDCSDAPTDAAPMTRSQALDALQAGARSCFACSPQDTLRPT